MLMVFCVVVQGTCPREPETGYEEDVVRGAIEINGITFERSEGQREFCQNRGERMICWVEWHPVEPTSNLDTEEEIEKGQEGTLRPLHRIHFRFPGPLGPLITIYYVSFLHARTFGLDSRFHASLPAVLSPPWRHESFSCNCSCTMTAVT